MNLKIIIVELLKKSFNYDQTGKRRRIIREFVKKLTLFHEYSILFINIKLIRYFFPISFQSIMVSFV